MLPFTLQWATVAADLLKTVPTIKSKMETKSVNINHTLNAEGINKHIQIFFHSGSEHQSFGSHKREVNPFIS